jgi:hypothetical protein
MLQKGCRYSGHAYPNCVWRVCNYEFYWIYPVTGDIENVGSDGIMKTRIGVRKVHILKSDALKYSKFIVSKTPCYYVINIVYLLYYIVTRVKICQNLKII